MPIVFLIIAIAWTLLSGAMMETYFDCLDNYKKFYKLALFTFLAGPLVWLVATVVAGGALIDWVKR